MLRPERKIFKRERRSLISDGEEGGGEGKGERERERREEKRDRP